LESNSNTIAANLATETTNRTTGDTNLQNELDATQTGAGLGTGGGYTTLETSNYLKAADFTGASLSQSLFNATVLLDIKLKAVADNTDGNIGNLASLTTDAKNTLVAAINEVDAHTDTNATNLATETTNRTNADTALQNELNATQTGAGLNTDGTYTANGSANYISAATSMKDADNKLDTALKTEYDRAVAAEGTLTTNLAAEVTRATGVEGTLSSLTTTAKNTLVAAINELDADLATEASTRGTNDNTLQSNINAEAATRLADDNAIDARIDDVNDACGISGDTYTANGSANYISAATSLKDADNKLDTALKTTIDNYASTTATTRGTALIGYKGYVEQDNDITNPTIEITAGTLEAALEDIAASVNFKIHEMESRHVKGEVTEQNQSDTYSIAHNLDTVFVDVSVQVYDTVDTIWRFDLVVIEVIDANTIKISLASGTAARIRYVIQGY